MTTPGAPYQAQLILGKDYKFNQTAYEEYSPLLLPAAFVLRWAGMMALLPAMPIFVYLWHRNLFAPIFKSWFKSDPLALWKSDVHCCLMSRYKEVPPLVMIVRVRRHRNCRNGSWYRWCICLARRHAIVGLPTGVYIQ
ncbi:hypothetical protein V2G26_019821 [Clonostachys chloroleuca]